MTTPEDKTKPREYSTAIREGREVILVDGHTMFFEDVVKDLNSYYQGFCKQQAKIERLEERIENASEILWEETHDIGDLLNRVDEALTESK